jgi:hypothetical protein
MSEDRLTTLLTDAVSDIEAADRLGEIRERIARSDRRHRAWWVAGGGAALAVAASIAVIAMSSNPHQPQLRAPDPAGPGQPSVTTDQGTGPVEVAGQALTVYYLGDGGHLYREFTQASDSDPFPAVVAALMATPIDPDYRSLWPEGSLTGVDFDGTGADGSFSVTLSDSSWADRPAGMTPREAELAIQSVVYTLQTSFHAKAPVEFYAGNRLLDTVLGVPAERDPAHSGVRDFPAAPVLDTLNHVLLTTPQDGVVIGGGQIDVRGGANSFEANVPWLIEDAQGHDVDQGSFIADGWQGERLFTFTGSIDVSSLDPGTYSLIVFTDDPSGGAEGGGAYADSRTFRIE